MKTLLVLCALFVGTSAFAASHHILGPVTKATGGWNVTVDFVPHPGSGHHTAALHISHQTGYPSPAVQQLGSVSVSAGPTSKSFFIQQNGTVQPGAAVYFQSSWNNAHRWGGRGMGEPATVLP